MRHSIRFRIFAAAAAIPMLLTSAALLFLSAVSERQIRNRTESEMGAAGRVLAALIEVHMLQLRNQSDVVASASGLKAALSTGDPRTVKDVLRTEIALPESWDAVLVRNRSGALLAHLEREGPRFRDARGRAPDALDAPPGEIPIVSDGRRLAWAHRAPIRIQEEEIGSLVAVERLDQDLLSEFAGTARGEVTLVHDGVPVETTLPEREARDLPGVLASLGREEGGGPAATRVVRLGGERFVSVLLSASSGSARPGTDGFLLLRSLDAATAALLAPIRRTLLGVGALAVLAAILVSFVLARGITASLQRLVTATREMREGTYDRAIRVESRDEIGILAGHFEEMRQALQRHLDLLDRRYREILETQAKLTEAQSQLVQSEKLAAMGRLTAQISHELNNPIHNIRSIMELLLTKVPEADPRREFVLLVAREADRMSDLTRRLLDFYRPATERMESLAVHDVLAETLAVSEPNLAGQGIRVETAFAAGAPIVAGSENQLKQVFLNLIVNASDAMPSGGTLRVESRLEEGGVLLVFRDTGAGIAPEHIDKVFDAFFTTKSQASGVGLGLSVSYGIVQRHKGTIRVESAPGRGAAFFVWLPLAARPAGALAPSARS